MILTFILIKSKKKIKLIIHPHQVKQKFLDLKIVKNLNLMKTKVQQTFALIIRKYKFRIMILK